jgi:hypothetical protein
MPDKLSWITDELNALQEQGLRTPPSAPLARHVGRGWWWTANVC